MAAGGTCAGNVFSPALVIIEKICGHDRFMYPAFQAAGQGGHAFHPPYNFLFPDALASLPAFFLYPPLENHEGIYAAFTAAFQITGNAGFILCRVKSASACKPPSAAQTVKRRLTPRGAAVFPAFQRDKIIPVLKDCPQGAAVPLQSLCTGIDVQHQCFMVVDNFYSRAYNIINLVCMEKSVSRCHFQIRTGKFPAFSFV